MKLKAINPCYYYQLFISVVKFVVSPQKFKGTQPKTISRLTEIFVLFVISLVLKIFSTLLITIFGVVGKQNIGFDQAFDLYAPLTLALIVTFLGPLLEETAFRLSLKFKPSYFSLSTTLITYFILTKAIFNVPLLDFEHELPTRIGGALLLGLLSYFVSKKHSDIFNKFWEDHFRWILYFFVILFGGFHIFNYDYTHMQTLSLPFFIFPQLISGVIYGFIRMKHGFGYSMLAHSLNNSLVILKFIGH